MPRLPNPGSDQEQWGDLLNEFLQVAHHADGTAANIVPSIAALKTITPSDSAKLGTASVSGYVEPGDGGGGAFFWDATSVDADNGGTLIALTTGGTGRWKRPAAAVINAKQFGAAPAASAAVNRAAIQAAITAIDTAGGGVLRVEPDIAYGFKVWDLATHPDFTTCQNSLVVEDHSPGISWTPPAKDGAQIRFFYHTRQTTPAGQHDGNGQWIRGAWSPYLAISNDAGYAPAGHATRTADDNRRANIFFFNDGIATWKIGQGTLDGAALSNDEMSNFTVTAFGAGSLGDYAPLVIERLTGNWAFGSETNAPPASYHFKSKTTGYVQGMFEALSTTVQLVLRTSGGAGDDVALVNESGDIVLRIASQGDAITVNKSDRYVGIGVTRGSFKLDVSDARSGNAVSRTTNASAINGSVANWISASPQGPGWRFLAAHSDNGTNQTFELGGDGNGRCDGAWIGGGADYAEYFEWADANAEGEDRRGCSVALQGSKIRLAGPGDVVIGVITANPSVVGDAAWNHWIDKYLRDDFGSYIMEDYDVWEWDEPGAPEDAGARDPVAPASLHHSYASDAVPPGLPVPAGKTVCSGRRRKRNPLYREDVAYTPRADRPEWGCVGLLGKLRVRKGQPRGERWVHLRDISALVDEWLVR